MFKINSILLYSVLFIPSLAFSAGNTKGLEIATEVDVRANGFIDMGGDMVMVLRNASGKESIRKMRSMTLEVPGDGDKFLTIFDEPLDVKGTAFLTFNHALEPDDQWLYLPSFKRVKRISSKNKSGSFMGSEFAFEDIGSQELDKYTYNHLANEVLDGRDMFVLEMIPKIASNSSYARLISWIDAEHYYTVKTEYYDRKNELLKTLTQSDFVLHLGQFWRSNSLIMENHRNNKSTSLRWHGMKFQKGLPKSDFESQALKRMR